MNRRSLLRGLLALPLAPLVAKLLPAARIPIRVTDAITSTDAWVLEGMDEAIGSDQTSIWMVDWDNGRVYTDGDVVMQRMANDLESKLFYEDFMRPGKTWTTYARAMPLLYPQLSVQEKIRRAVRGSVGGRA